MMMKLRNKLSILIILAMIFTMVLSSQVYATDNEEVPSPVSLEKLSNLDAEVLEKQIENTENESLVLKLDKLNFYQE